MLGSPPAADKGAGGGHTGASSLRFGNTGRFAIRQLSVTGSGSGAGTSDPLIRPTRAAGWQMKQSLLPATVDLRRDRAASCLALGFTWRM